jgi:hypothetical protein
VKAVGGGGCACDVCAVGLPSFLRPNLCFPCCLVSRLALVLLAPSPPFRSFSLVPPESPQRALGHTLTMTLLALLPFSGCLLGIHVQLEGDGSRNDTAYFQVSDSPRPKLRRLLAVHFRIGLTMGSPHLLIPYATK